MHIPCKYLSLSTSSANFFFFSTRIERLAAQYKAKMFLFDLIIYFSNMRGEMSSLHFVRTVMEKAWKMDLNGVWGGPLRGNSDGTWYWPPGRSSGMKEIVQDVNEVETWASLPGCEILDMPGNLSGLQCLRLWDWKHVSLVWVYGMGWILTTGKKTEVFIFKTQSRSDSIRLISTRLICIACRLNWFIRVA